MNKETISAMIKAVEGSIASSKKAGFTVEQTVDAALTAAKNVAKNASDQQTVKALNDALQTVSRRAKELKLSVDEAGKQMIQVLKDKMGHIK